MAERVERGRWAYSAVLREELGVVSVCASFLSFLRNFRERRTNKISSSDSQVSPVKFYSRFDTLMQRNLANCNDKKSR